MIRKSSAATFVVAVIATLVILPRLMPGVDTAGPVVRCNLQTDGGCRWDTGQGRYTAVLESGDREAEGVRHTLSLTGPDGEAPVLAILTGESMYMGEYPVPLSRKSAGQWQAEFVAPFCTEEGDMVWKISLYAGQQPLHDDSLRLWFKAP
ncbi:MAG: hypothetical protein SVX28_01775 [Pseudomonadota bacterium]|nr:hypothetical protein [Pseudomonadota bacterium]